MKNKPQIVLKNWKVIELDHFLLVFPENYREDLLDTYLDHVIDSPASNGTINTVVEFNDFIEDFKIIISTFCTVLKNFQLTKTVLTDILLKFQKDYQHIPNLFIRI